MLLRLFNFIHFQYIISMLLPSAPPPPAPPRLKEVAGCLSCCSPTALRCWSTGLAGGQIPRAAYWCSGLGAGSPQSAAWLCSASQQHRPKTLPGSCRRHGAEAPRQENQSKWRHSPS